MKPLPCVVLHLLFHPRRGIAAAVPPLLVLALTPRLYAPSPVLGPRDVILERFVRVLCIRLSVPSPYPLPASRRVTSACASAAIKIRSVALVGTRPAPIYTGRTMRRTRGNCTFFVVPTGNALAINGAVNLSEAERTYFSFVSESCVRNNARDD